MPIDDPRLGMRGGAGPGLLGRLVGAAVGAVVLVASLLFSVVVFAVLLAAAVLIGGYLWWRTREIRKQMREQMERMDEQMRATGAGRPAAGAGDRRGTVLDGDFIREREHDSGRDPRE